MRTLDADHVTVSWLHTAVGSVTLLCVRAPPLTHVSLRFVPTPTAQPSPAGSPCEAMPACSPRRRRFGFTHSSSVRLAAGTGALRLPVLASSTALPASENGPAAPGVTSPTYAPSRSFAVASWATVPDISASRR